VDAKSSIPLYLQLRDELMRRIRSGEFKPLDRLPSERELCETYQISRMTVRQALQSLVRDGLLYTRVGKGTYVSPVKFEQDQSLSGFTEEMRKSGRMPTSKVLNFSTIPASASLAGALGVLPNSPVYRLERLRMVEDAPIAFERAHIPKELCPDLQRYDFGRQSLYDVMRRIYGLQLVSAQQTIQAAIADEQEMALFNLDRPLAVLRMTRRTMTDKNVVAEYVESVYRGDSYVLRAFLVAQRPPAS
jgi:GntR family transcriptional regulator